MSDAQSYGVPPSGRKPALRDLAWLVPVSARALLELARARLSFMRLEAKQIAERNSDVRRECREPDIRNQSQRKMIRRIGYVLPRLSARVPWRSDCLIQALAGQNWLSAKGLASAIEIGVMRPENDTFSAHAWLVCGNYVLTGQDIEPYSPMLQGGKNLRQETGHKRYKEQYIDETPDISDL